MRRLYPAQVPGLGCLQPLYLDEIAAISNSSKIVLTSPSSPISPNNINNREIRLNTLFRYAITEIQPVNEGYWIRIEIYFLIRNHIESTVIDRTVPTIQEALRISFIHGATLPIPPLEYRSLRVRTECERIFENYALNRSLNNYLNTYRYFSILISFNPLIGGLVDLLSRYLNLVADSLGIDPGTIVPSRNDPYRFIQLNNWIISRFR
jgi:hypothetical protein